MINKNAMYTIGEIIETCGLPVFIRRMSYDINFFVELTSVSDEIAYGEAFRGTNPTGRQYSYSLSDLAFYCEWQDLKNRQKETESLIVEAPTPLPPREKSRFHEYRDASLPDYVPGETVLRVKRSGEWVNAVFTGFEKREGSVLAYTYYKGQEAFCRFGGNYIGEPVPYADSGAEAWLAIEELKDRTTSKEVIFRYLTEERGVKYLIHFTPINNLNSIFENGIAPRVCFGDSGEIIVTDITRWDNHPECSCFSLSFPNYQMLNTKRRTTGRRFAVLVIDISAMLAPGVDKLYYLPVNASYNGVRWNITDYTQLRDAKNMFADELEYKGVTYLREKLDIPKEYPTSPQAELMIDGIVPPKYVREIHFCDQRTKIDAAGMVKWIPDETEVKVDRQYFLNRKDSGFW